ncbi:hypothetical protein F2Q68_00040032 [Brassica cretica]|uniref:Uncharacterized protein n=1 Tax=Brassica cretica TaxID=69181 RepID=A0A8S9MSD2_BRACR|nr:hypothetical protein F2Q68_00040032 [Brassica cretica]
MGTGTELNVYRKLSELMGSVIWRLPGAVTEQLLERYWIGKPSKAVGREQLQAGLSAERLGWWRNRPSVSFKWDFADQREGHGFLDRKIDKKTQERTEGKELRERQTDPNRDIRPDGRFKPPLVDASASCSDATSSDPYTNGSRLGYQEMVPKSDGLIVQILPDGRRVLTWQELFEAVNRCIVLERDTGGMDSDRVSAFCTGYDIEPSVDGSIMTGPRLVLDGGMVLLTGYGAVEPSTY